MSSSNSPLLEDITNTDEALDLFDSLPAIEVDFMMGAWRGYEVPTRHPMDGLLAASAWYGKRFDDVNHVHPLVHQDDDGELFCVDPAKIPIGVTLKVPGVKRLASRKLFLMSRRFISTTRHAATLQMIEYRGVETATMVYNDKPIRDAFRKLGPDSVLGAMEMDGMRLPYFFGLDRDG